MIVDLPTRAALAAAAGRDPPPRWLGTDVLEIRVPWRSPFRFEWHPGRKKTYLVRLGTTPEIGEILGEHTDDYPAAVNFVAAYIRGWRHGAGLPWSPAVRPEATDDLMREFMARPAHPSGGSKNVFDPHVGPGSWIIRGPVAAGTFRWIPVDRMLYAYESERAVGVGRSIAWLVETHGQAVGYAQTFQRGWREAQEPGVKLHLAG